MNNKLIYDVGLNNGDDTAYYLNKGFDVLAIEADPILVSSAHQRFKSAISVGQLSILNIGIGPKREVAKFWICEEFREWNSFDKEIASRNGFAHHSIDVECLPFREVLDEYGVPFFLKIDIEGHDHFCLEDLDPDDIPKYISVELSGINDLIILRDLGYNAFKIITQNDHSQLQLHSPHKFPSLRAMLRNNLKIRRMLQPSWNCIKRFSDGFKPVSETKEQWFFSFGSSGKFGEESDGSWKTFEEAAFLCLAYQFGHTHYGSPSLKIWHDLHATQIEW